MNLLESLVILSGSGEATTISRSRIGTMNHWGEGARTALSALSASRSSWDLADKAVRAPKDGSGEGPG
jgi:hypothetical protein